MISCTNGKIVICNEHDKSTSTVETPNNRLNIGDITGSQCGTLCLRETIVNDNIYTCVFDYTGDSKFPCLVIGNEAKKPQSITVDECCIEIINHKANSNKIELNIKLSATDQNLSKIKEGSILLVHRLWLTIRLKVKSVNSSTDNSQCFLNVEAADEPIYEYISRLDGDAKIEIINPNVSVENLGVDNYIFREENITYKSETCPTSEDCKIVSTGTLLELQNCSNLTILNLEISNNGVTDVLEGSWTQAEVETVPCVKVENCENITFDGITFKGIFGYCIWVENCRNIKIRNCKVEKCFGGGFLINNSSECEIVNNSISEFGIIQGGGVGIVLKENVCNTIVSNNSISNGNYSGISVGWRWGYRNEGRPETTGNTISFNCVCNCMQGLSNDGAGIYLLGVDEGNVVENNIVHDIRSRNGEQGYAFYLDEGSSYVRCRNNIFYKCDGGIHIHYGYANEIYNNIIAYNTYAAFIYSRQKGPLDDREGINNKQMGCIVYNNYFRSDDVKLFIAGNDAMFVMTRNLFDVRGDKKNLPSKEDVRFIENYYGHTDRIINDEGGTPTINNSNALYCHFVAGFPVYYDSNIGLRIFRAIQDSNCVGANTVQQII